VLGSQVTGAAASARKIGDLSDIRVEKSVTALALRSS
jgi:hypothetical protein